MKLKRIIDIFVFSSIIKSAKKHLTVNVFNCLRSNFKKIIVRENSVLILEFLNFHGENFPSLIKYSLDMGYNVDVVLRKTSKTGRNDLGLFSCFSGNQKVRIKILSGMDMNLLLRSIVATEYKHIIIITFTDIMKRNHLLKVDFFKLKPICMMHNPDTVVNDYFKTCKIISPVRMDCISRERPHAVSIHYFGDFFFRKKSQITTFVTLNTDDITRRNLHLLFYACDTLYENNINNFQVKIIGNGITIPDRFRNKFQILGFLDFQKMYDEIYESDFLLALIDQASIKYTNKASGSYGLSYGFLKPILLHRKFADVSGFDDENSILYDDNCSLADSMKKCINMSDSCYEVLVSSLKVTKKTLYNHSLNNLKKAMEAPLKNVSRYE